jgi:hypothetical protein
MCESCAPKVWSLGRGLNPRPAAVPRDLRGGRCLLLEFAIGIYQAEPPRRPHLGTAFRSLKSISRKVAAQLMLAVLFESLLE